jgi:hypothetical protein
MVRSYTIFISYERLWSFGSPQFRFDLRTDFFRGNDSRENFFRRRFQRGTFSGETFPGESFPRETFPFHWKGAHCFLALVTELAMLTATAVLHAILWRFLTPVLQLECQSIFLKKQKEPERFLLKIYKRKYSAICYDYFLQ